MAGQRAFCNEFLLFRFQKCRICTGDSGQSDVHLFTCFIQICRTGGVGFDQHCDSFMILFSLLKNSLSLVLIGFESI